MCGCVLSKPSAKPDVQGGRRGDNTTKLEAWVVLKENGGRAEGKE